MTHMTSAMKAMIGMEVTCSVELGLDPLLDILYLTQDEAMDL